MRIPPKPLKRLSTLQILIIVGLFGLFFLYEAYTQRQAAQTPETQLSPTPFQGFSPTPAAASPVPSRTPAPGSTPTRGGSPTPTRLSPLASDFGDFDFFVLSLSWSPDYCASDGQNDAQQCSLGKKLGFVLHGLWPQYNQGYPSDCSTERLPAAIEAQFPGLYPNDSLADHEWEKHGTCSGLKPAAYLAYSKQLKESVSIPEEYRSPQAPFRTTTTELIQKFTQANPGANARAFAVYCSSNGRYLKELYVCFTKDGKPMNCSAEVQKDAARSCQNSDFLVRNTR